MTPREHFEPDTPVSIACNAGLEAVWDALPDGYTEAFDPVVIVLVQPKNSIGDPTAETHGIAVRGVEDTRGVLVELLAAAQVAAKTLGLRMNFAKLLPTRRGYG